MIKYKDLKEKKYTLIEFKSIIKKALNTEHLTNPWIHQIVFYALSNLNFKKLKNNRNSVDKYSKKVIEIFFPSGVLNKTNPTEYFFYNILEFEELPFIKKTEIEATAKSDLKKIETLLQRYRSTSFISEYESKPRRPKNPTERLDLFFFERTKIKREEILNYLLQESDEISIRLSEKPFTSSVFNYKGAPDIIRLPFIYPYNDFIIKNKESAFGIDWGKIDSKKINLLENKWEYLDFGSVCYEYDEETYAILKNIKPKKILKKLIKKSKKIEALKNRLSIFKELKHLFLDQKFYGFYALALPQIEGLFKDMLKIIQKRGNNSLPNRVNALRDLYPDSNYAFDYYEFFLPIQRNTFSHTGEDSNIEAKSYQILLDLIYVTNIYENLNSPLVELDRIINSGTSNFKNIGSFSEYFSLITNLNLKLNQSDYSLEKINEFNSQLFNNNSHTDSILNKLISDFELSFRFLFRNLDGYFGHKYDIKNISNEELAKAAKQIKSYLDINVHFFYEHLKLIFDTITFIEKYHKVVKLNITGPEEVIKKLKSIDAYHKAKIIKGNLGYIVWDMQQ